MESPFKADILKGKMALLTGGGSGIGHKTSTQLGKHGALITVMDRRKNVLDSAKWCEGNRIRVMKPTYWLGIYKNIDKIPLVGCPVLVIHRAKKASCGSKKI